MKHLLSLVFIFLFTSSIVYADEWVNGYYNNNGNYVNGYYRTNRDNNPYNNYSTQDNTNSYTG